MQFTDIAKARLHNQHLLKKQKDPLAVLEALGAMQAQEFRPAKWALGLRSKANDHDIQRLFDEGKILRTHILRPTWHFVLPEDIRWIQELTAPRVHAFCKYYRKQLELDENVLQRSVAVLAKALAGKSLTRSEIKGIYEAKGIDASGLRLGQFLMYAELEALVCSGPMRGKQHTYMLVSERAPHAKRLDREAALAELTKRFFTAHGPATISDFAWWSSLTVADIKQGIQLAKVPSIEIEDATFYYTGAPKTKIPSPSVHLLPVYDELTIPYKERRPYGSILQGRDLYKTRELFYNLLAIDGQIAGGWRWYFDKDSCRLQINLFRQMNADEQASLNQDVSELGDFLGMPVSSKILS